MPTCKFTKKLFQTSSFMSFAFIFSECMTITSSEEGLKVCMYNFFQQKVVLLVIYLLNHDSSESTIFMVNMAFDVLLCPVFVKYSKLESFVSCNIKLFALCFDMYFFDWNLIILHHGDNNFLFWYLYQIRTFNNNLNKEGMITSHLICANSFMIKILL